MTIADKILDFYAKVHFTGQLPDKIDIMNPFRESEDIRRICKLFYDKYYNDEKPRTLILGINPGRLGAGATGLPFTDTKRLNEFCGIQYDKFVTHEPSSVYVYEVIEAFGGPDAFYHKFYINSVCPLGFIKKEGAKIVNYNYYDSKALQDAVTGFIIENINQQLAIAGKSDKCFCFGTGKNFQFLNKLNQKHGFFDQIVPLEHPRYIMQYKTKQKDKYISNYLELLGS
jgi:hypothetical protein